MQEIFELAQTMATKAYSPVMVDQLSQDQIIKETSLFVIKLFEEFINTELVMRDCLEFDDLVKKIVHRNFDVDNEQLFIVGLSLFLFIKLSKLYSENLNFYQMMEKLVSNLLEKIPLLYFEFLVFLHIIHKEEQVGLSKLMQGIFQGMYFDKICDLLIRCCNQIESFKEILIGTLKHIYVNLNTEIMLEIIKVVLLSVVKSKSDSFKQVILFVMKVFNPKVGFDLEIIQPFKNLSSQYRSVLRTLLQECIKPSAGPLQMNFWAVHKIITQE